MAQGSRPARIGDQLREEISMLLAREVKDPGVGFVTITHVKVTADLQLARVYYSAMGDPRALEQSARALERATPYVRRQIAQRLRLRRAPEIVFIFDESLERQDRVEQLFREIREADQQRAGELDTESEQRDDE
jgi:ribosome-binding factor A